jgi:steroid 5-alpha reductase family enzyme
VIFLSVNAALVLAWVGLTIAGVHFKVMLWPSAVVIGLWALRLVFEARAAYRGKPEGERYSEDRIRRELSRMP